MVESYIVPSNNPEPHNYFHTNYEEARLAPAGLRCFCSAKCMGIGLGMQASSSETAISKTDGRKR